MSEEGGGRIFFSNVRRSLEIEDEIRLTSVGVDIGSSTSHLVFSRLVLERLDNRYVVSERKVIHESEVLLTPYAGDATIDALALGRFIDRQYELGGIDSKSIDTGALILTGVAVRRSNARAIGELFAAQAGKFVSVSAGDALEATLAAFGSGACARSIRESARVMHVDIGGGTSKIAVCEAGDVVELTAADIGARIVSFDSEGRVQRIEEAGRRFAGGIGLALEIGRKPEATLLNRMIERMADRLFEVISEPKPGAEAAALLRLDPLRNERKPDVVTFSGGVAEYIYGREGRAFGDLGPQLARAVLARVKAWGPRIETSDAPFEKRAGRHAQFAARGRDSRRGANFPGHSRRLASARSGRRRARGGPLLPLEGLGDVRASGRLLPGNRRRPCEWAWARPPAHPGRRRRRRGIDRHPLPGRDAAIEPDRVDRRDRAQGIRLHRHRRSARDLRRRAGRDQVAGVPDGRTGAREGRYDRLT